jgi:hypothetical protein
MLFFVNQTYSPTMSEIEIYVCVRQFRFGVAEQCSRERLEGTTVCAIAIHGFFGQH